MTARVRPIRFLIAWFAAAGLVLPFAPLLSLTIATMVAVPIKHMLSLIPAPNRVDGIPAILFIGLLAFAYGWCIGALQKLVVKRYLDVVLRRWCVVSALGGSLAGAAAILSCQGSCIADEVEHLWTQPSLRPADELLLTMFVFLGILSAVQFLMLRRQLPSAPLWIVAHIVSVPLVYGLWRSSLASQFPNVDSWVIVVVSIHFVAALVTAAVMLRIVSLAMNGEKAKRNAEARQETNSAPLKSHSPLADDA